MQTRNRLYFPSIDILRGFAALSVVVYHVIDLFGWKTFPTEGPLVWFRIGWMGVDLFFVISGFVIGLSAFAEIGRHGPNSFQRPFMRRRLIRIVPLYYLTGLLFVALVVPQLLFENFLQNAITHVLFIHNLFPAFHGAINGSNWSLGTEMQFYVLVLFAAPWIVRSSGWKVLAGFVLVAWAWRYGSALVFPVQGDQGVFRLFLVSTQLPGMLDEFAAGLLLAKLLRSEHGAVLLRMSPLWSVLAAAAAISSALAVFWRFTYWDSPSMVVFYRTLLAAAFFLVLLAACTLNAPRWPALTTPFRYLGTISYGIYLWHLPVLLTLKELRWLTPERAMPWVIGLTICLASVSWHFFEQPIARKYAKKSITVPPSSLET